MTLGVDCLRFVGPKSGTYLLYHVGYLNLECGYTYDNDFQSISPVHLASHVHNT